MEKFIRVNKAYTVGSKEDINRPYYPESGCSVILVEELEGVNKAKYEFMKGDGYYNYPSLKFIDIRARRCRADDLYIFRGEKLTMDRIYRITALEEWRSDMEKLVAENKGKKVYIYSGEWNSYWCSNGAGYTTKISDVGVYDIEDAWKRVHHGDIDKRISFELVKH